jgi:polar amino acid transport system ATP-binding protein
MERPSNTESVESRYVVRWSKLKKIIQLEDGSIRTVLDLPELTIPRGKLTCILGPSGSGKTTLLGILGLVDFDYEAQDFEFRLANDVHRMDGERTKARQRKARGLRQHLGYVFQEIRLRNDGTALENVVDPLMYLGRGTPSQRLDYARTCLELFDLDEGHHDRRISAFSGGMQQRTALARAVAVQPELICADEPTAHVDGKLADDIYSDLKRKAGERGISVVVVTHDEERANKYADHIIRLEARHPEDPKRMRDTLESGEWPYKAAIAREAEGAPARAWPGEARLGSASVPSRIWDMSRVALQEFKPLVDRMTQLVLAPTVDLVKRIASPNTFRPRPPIARHLYSALWVSILTFGALAAMGFMFHSVQRSIIAYQEEQLESMEILRRVRMVAPGNHEGRRIAMSTDKLLAAMNKTEGVEVTSISTNFDLVGYALTNSDTKYLESNGDYGIAQQRLLKKRRRRRTTNGKIDTANDRFGVRFAATDPGEALYKDLGLPQDIERFSKGDDKELPTIFVTDDEISWQLIGQLEKVPTRGDTLSIFFKASPKIRESGQAAGDGQADAAKPVRPQRIGACFRFKIGGHLQVTSAPDNFQSRVEGSSYMHAAMRQEAFQRILNWKADPLNPSTQIPDAWRCKGSPPPASKTASYWDNDESRSRKPVAKSVDIYAASPEQVSALHDAVVAYAADHDIIADDVYSERGFIAPVVRLMNIAWIVGLILQIVPLLVGAIVLWLVIHSLLQRRRQELLLCLVMGAPPWQLQVQSLALAILIIIPGLLLGYVLGAMLPDVLLSMMGEESLEAYANILKHLETARIDFIGLIQVSAITFVFAAVASLSVTRSITDTNPAGAFRGTV